MSIFRKVLSNFHLEWISIHGKMELALLSPILFISFLISCAVQTSSGPKKTMEDIPITKEMIENVHLAEKQGEKIYKLDATAAMATDWILAKRFAERENRVRGWVVVTENDGTDKVIFLGEVEGKTLILSTVILSAGRINSYEEISEPSAEVLAMYKARQIALKHKPFSCAERYNAVVFRENGNWTVYTLPATTIPQKVIVGGSHRFRVSADGEKNLEVKSLTKSCLQFNSVPPDAKGLFVTHLVDPVPSEIHSYLSLLQRIPIYVITSTGVWKADGGKICYLGKKSQILKNQPAREGQYQISLEQK